MNADYKLSPELMAAARTIEERATILGLPLEGIELREWDVLAPELHSLIPPWIPALHSRFKIANITLEFSNFDDDATYSWPLRFHWPQSLGIDLKDGLYREIYYRDLIAHGFFVFAAAEGGPDWAVTLSKGPEGSIYFFNQSDYSGGLPTEDNGLVYAHKNLASLLAAMAISNMNYPGGHAPRDRAGVWGK